MGPLNAPLGRTIVRKHAGPTATDVVDLIAQATVSVTSERELFPVDHLFDGRCGRGGSCWVAARPGAQTIVLRFATPVDLESITIESEEQGITSTQQIDVAGWSETRHGPFEGAPRVLHYSPYGTTFHRETWTLSEQGVSHVWIRVTPAPLIRFATLTAIIFR